MRQEAPRRRSRFWLFAPFILLVLAALGWSAVWFVIRARTAEGLDAWLANEAVAGRRWECPERAIQGFPFRIEVACARIALQSRDLSLSTGRLVTVTQIYKPRHTIAELEGPLRLSGPGINLDATWSELRVSLQRAPHALERLSVVAENPTVKASGLPVGPSGEIAGTARHAEAHLRPAPGLPESDNAYELAKSVTGGSIPALDPILGAGSEPIEAQFQAVVTQARVGAPRREEVERWREAGGRVLLNRLTLAKGPRRLEAKGELALDDARRPTGRVDVAAAGLGDLLATITGGRVPGPTGGVLGNLLQPRPRQPPADPGQAAGTKLTSLPPIRLENGRVLVGPFTVPGLRLAPVY
jgi:hypothetical protein